MTGVQTCALPISFAQTDESPIDIPSTETINKVAKILAKGKIVAWYQGNGEIGPER